MKLGSDKRIKRWRRTEGWRGLISSRLSRPLYCSRDIKQMTEAAVSEWGANECSYSPSPSSSLPLLLNRGHFCTITDDIISNRAQQWQIIVRTWTQQEGNMRSWKSCRATEEEFSIWNIYLITMEMHNTLLLMQLSAPIGSTVEYHLKQVLIMQLWCKRILDHLLSHGCVWVE